MRRLIIIMLAQAVFSIHAGAQNITPTTVQENMRGWAVDKVADGMVWYNYTGYYPYTDANQTINILEIDTSKGYFLKVLHSEQPDSLSGFADAANAVAGINGSYFEPDVSFVRVNGKLWREVTAQPDFVGFWKHSGALMLNDKTGEIAIEYGNNDSYLKSRYSTVLSGAPMLIYDYSPVGETFAAIADTIDIKKLHYEDYRRHQGVRHPRVAVAVSEDGKILLATVDGRWWSSAGMSCAELTQMLVRHFNPRYALNIDGGGSTTMLIRGRGVMDTNVVNFPVDNKVYDHYGQRVVNNVVLVCKH